MARIQWKENKILCVETRKGLFVLAQMLKEPYLLFFNIFSSEKDCRNLDPTSGQILFYTAVAREFLNSSNIIVHKLNAESRRDLCIDRIKTESIYRKTRLWKGTENEIEILILGHGGKLVRKDPYGSGMSKDELIVMNKIENSDTAAIDKFELDRMLFHPTLNERLYLCYKFGKNVDPIKDFVFDRDVPLDYLVFARLYSNTIALEEWKELAF
jgi:hypothetical protein